VMNRREAVTSLLALASSPTWALALGGEAMGRSPIR
jgi:hypothetical protein